MVVRPKWDTARNMVSTIQSAVANSIIIETGTFLMVLIEHCLFSLSQFMSTFLMLDLHTHPQIHSLPFSVPPRLTPMDSSCQALWISCLVTPTFSQ